MQEVLILSIPSTKDFIYCGRLSPGVCPKAVAKGFRCIFSNQGVWYLDHLDVPWDQVYNAEPLEGIDSVSEQNLVLGGEAVCGARQLIHQMFSKQYGSELLQRQVYYMLLAKVMLH